MAKRTPAIDLLERSLVQYELHSYEIGDADISYGEAVARALGVDPRRLFKTLVAEVDGNPVVAIVPVSGKLSMKKLARAAGGKRARMADVSVAERLTGYVVGGVSPFGQKRRMPMFVDVSADVNGTLFVSAGRRGYQVEVGSEVLIRLTGATVTDLVG